MSEPGPNTNPPSASLGSRLKTWIVKKFFSPDDIAWKNEIAANLFVAKVMLATAALDLVFIVLSMFDLFSVRRGTMLGILIPVFFFLLIPAFVCFRLKGEKKWLKLFLLPVYILVFALVELVLTHNVILCLVFPIILSVRYYSRALTICTGLLTSLVLLFSSWLSIVLRIGPLDLNLVHLQAGAVLQTSEPGTLREIVMSQAAIDYSHLWQHMLTQSFLPKFLLFLMITLLCGEIAFYGRSVIIQEQAEVKKTERLTMELELAKTIQNNMLPSIYPAFPERKEFDVYARMEPAKELGGDFYDFQMIDKDHLALIIADVSGKGIPAAMFMMASKIIINNLSKNRSHDPAKILRAVNKQIGMTNHAEMFVTLWLGILEISTGKLSAANAGHEYPCLKQNDESFSLLKDPHGLVLGALDNTVYRSYDIQLAPGDTLFLYTDGVTEAATTENELFGAERLVDALNLEPSAPVATLVDHVRSAITGFVGDAPQADDITMMALRYYGEAGRPDYVAESENASEEDASPADSVSPAGDEKPAEKESALPETQ